MAVFMLPFLLVVLAVGAIAGWLAGLIVQGRGFGLFGDIVIGILGAFIGGFVLHALGIFIIGGLLGVIVGATIGAVILLLIIGVLRRV